MSDSRKLTYTAIAVLFILLFFALGYVSYYLYVQLGISTGSQVVLSIVNGIATSVLAFVAFMNMREARRGRSEMVRPHLSLEPSFYEYDSQGQIRGFNCLNLVNGGAVARDVEIDITIKDRTNLFYTSSIGTSDRVQIWSGQSDELGGNIIVSVKYKNMFNKSLVEVLSINMDSIKSAQRKFAPLHKT